MIAVKTPLPMPVAAMAAGPSGPTIRVSTRPMLIQPISARMTGPARRRRGRSSFTGRRDAEAQRNYALRLCVSAANRSLEGNAEADLTDALLGLTEIAGVGGRLHERPERRA